MTAADGANPTRLRVVYEEIDRRVDRITTGRAWWPCAEGCDHCCRHLAEEPRMTSGEWARLRVTIKGVEPSQRAEIERRVLDLSRAPASATTVCPLLDLERGACTVYEGRPAACRTYGFFASRDADLRCERVNAAIEEHEPRDAHGTTGIVWGNHAAVERRLARAFGAARSLSDWWATEPPK